LFFIDVIGFAKGEGITTEDGGAHLTMLCTALVGWSIANFTAINIARAIIEERTGFMMSRFIKVNESSGSAGSHHKIGGVCG
jgi:hypothetical protein